MNDFFIHQSIQKNLKATDELNQYLRDLKVLTNGELANKAAIDLKATSDKVSDDLNKMSLQVSTDVTGLKDLIKALAADLKSSQLEIDAFMPKLHRLLTWGWLLLGVGLLTGVWFCYALSHVH